MKKTITIVFTLFTCVAFTFGQQSKAQISEAVVQSKVKTTNTVKQVVGQKNVTLKVADTNQNAQAGTQLSDKLAQPTLSNNQAKTSNSTLEQRRELQNLLDVYTSEKRSVAEILDLKQQIQNLK